MPLSIVGPFQLVSMIQSLTDDTGMPSAHLHVERSMGLPAYRVAWTNENLEAVPLHQPAAGPTRFTCAEDCNLLDYQHCCLHSRVVTTVHQSHQVSYRCAPFQWYRKNPVMNRASCSDFLILLPTLFTLFYLNFYCCCCSPGSEKENVKNLVQLILDEETVSQPLLNITVSGGVGRRCEIAKESEMYIYNTDLLTIARSLIERAV